ncbi:MAG: phosphatase PAP2 family protein [Candidatus Omnitrophota bacterium]
MKIKNLIIPLITILFLFNVLPLSAQEKQENQYNSPFFKSLLEDEFAILSSPARMKGKDFLIWGGAAVITGILIANDEAIYHGIKTFQAKHPWVSDVSPQITKLGLGEWNLGIAGTFYLGGLLLKDKRAVETARLITMTFIHTGMVVQLGKHMFSRQRPSWDNGKDHWAGPSAFFERYEDGQISHYDAFPSGHTITVFGTAAVIAEMYQHTVWVPILSYTLATLTGISRVTEDTHWLSDVFVGAFLGYAIGKFVAKRRNRLETNGLNIYPTASTHHLGLNLQYVF